MPSTTNDVGVAPRPPLERTPKSFDGTNTYSDKGTVLAMGGNTALRDSGSQSVTHRCLPMVSMVECALCAGVRVLWT